jgi:hypothetical protein
MNNSLVNRIGPICGIASPVVLFLAAGDGSSYAPWRTVVAAWALVLFLPYLAHLAQLLRRPGDDASRLLASTALVTGAAWVVLKVASDAPEAALSNAGVSSGALYHALDDMATAVTVLSLFPLAIFAAAVAAGSLRQGTLPRWLGVVGVLTAVAAAVNAGFLFSAFEPALLLFQLWTLLCAATLLRRGSDKIIAAAPSPATT